MIYFRTIWYVIVLFQFRFHNDNQISQLSKWVKPQVIKYSTFSESMTAFREFVGKSLVDPDLNMTIIKKPVSVLSYLSFEFCIYPVHYT